MAVDMSASNALEAAIDAKIAKAAPKRTQANGTVKRVDADGTAYVQLEGADVDTPVARTAAALKVGQEVGGTVRNGELVIDGNYSAPATDDTRAIQAQDTARTAIRDAARATSAAEMAEQSAAAASDAANRAITDAATAQASADQAQESAETAQTAAEQAISDAATAKTAADAAQDSADAASDALKSVVSGATTVEKAVSVMQTALEAVVDYDPATDTTQEWFWHDANGAHVLGDTSGYRNDIDSSGMNIVDVSTETSVAKFGERTRVGANRVADSMVLDVGDTNTGIFQIRRWADETSVQTYFKAIHDRDNNHDYVVIGSSVGTFPGYGHLSVALGRFQSSGEGPTGDYAIAEGLRTAASGTCSHSEGMDTEAGGNYSHAQNNHTQAAYDSQTAIGKYNDNQSANALEIGNGTSDTARSNALAVDWNGNALIAGEVQDMSGNAKYTKTRVKGNAETAYRTGDVNLTPANIGALALSGGTLTGGLTVNGPVASNNDTFYAKSTVTAFDRDGAVPASDTWKGGLNIRDVDDDVFAQLTAVKRNAANGGWNELGIYVYGVNSSGTQIQNNLNLKIKSDGSKAVTLDAASWRTALGLDSLLVNATGSQASGSIAAGGTANVTVAVTVPSGYTIAAIRRVSSGNAYVDIAGYYISGNSVVVALHNSSTSSRSGTTTVNCMCVKTAFWG